MISRKRIDYYGNDYFRRRGYDERIEGMAKYLFDLLLDAQTDIQTKGGLYDCVIMTILVIDVLLLDWN